MKKFFYTFLLLFVCLGARSQQVNYDEYFTADRLRIDLVFAGDATSQSVYLDGLTQECAWSGSKTTLVDPMKYGEYYLELRNKEGQTIYSKGFNTLFQEWRTIAEAKTTPKSFSSSCVVPFPKNTVQLVVSERVKSTGKFRQIYSAEINPENKLISRERSNDFKVTSILNNGNPNQKVDILFIAEGYTDAEMDKFRADAAKFSSYLFDVEPYKSRKSDFNIWAVESTSEESGTDIPHQNIWKKTVACSNFYTFEVDRYLTAPDQKIISRIASNAPYDAIYIIVNTDKYGGGGIYNFYGLSMSDHTAEAQVFVHEFGHSFAGLGDEYYDSSTTYEEFYNLKTEPWEPNITTLVNFDSKWKSMISKNTPQPTPNNSKYDKTVGVFEGGGYMAKGIYRPYLDCRMKSNTPKEFCPVCQAAISKMIDTYCK